MTDETARASLQLARPEADIRKPDPALFSSKACGSEAQFRQQVAGKTSVHAGNAVAACCFDAIGNDEDSFRLIYHRVAAKCHRKEQSEAP